MSILCKQFLRALNLRGFGLSASFDWVKILSHSVLKNGRNEVTIIMFSTVQRYVERTYHWNHTEWRAEKTKKLTASKLCSLSSREGWIRICRTIWCSLRVFIVDLMRLLIAEKLLDTLIYYLVAAKLTWPITRLRNDELFYIIIQTSSECFVICSIKGDPFFSLIVHWCFSNTVGCWVACIEVLGWEKLG